MSAKRDQYYDLAERLFIRDGVTLAAVGERLHLHKGTLTRWAAEGNWKENRKKYRQSTLGYLLRLEALREKALTVYEKRPSAAAMDTLSKLGSMVKTEAARIDLLAATVEVMDHYTTYVKRTDPERAEWLSGSLRGFFAEIERAA